MIKYTARITKVERAKYANPKTPGEPMRKLKFHFIINNRKVPKNQQFFTVDEDTSTPGDIEYAFRRRLAIDIHNEGQLTFSKKQKKKYDLDLKKWVGHTFATSDPEGFAMGMLKESYNAR